MLILGRFVGDIYTSAGIDRHIRDRQGIGIRDEQGADAVVVDGQFLNPFPVSKVNYMFFLDIQGFLAYLILCVPHFVPHIWRVFTEKFLEIFFAEHHKTQVGEGERTQRKESGTFARVLRHNKGDKKGGAQSRRRFRLLLLCVFRYLRKSQK